MRDTVKRVGVLFVKRRTEFLLGVGIVLLCLSCLIAWHFPAKSPVLVSFGLIFVAALLLCYGVTTLLRRKNRMTIYGTFLAFTVVSGFFYLLATLPGGVPDEVLHFNATYTLVTLVTGGDISEISEWMRIDDTEGPFNFLPVRSRTESLSEFFDSIALFADKPLFGMRIGSALGGDISLPQLRFASMIGILIGLFLNLSPLLVFYMGRLFNLVFFAVLAYLAVKITPIGKRVFVIICLFPMTLHLAASYSYDGAIIGYALLLLALFFKAIKGDGRMTLRLQIALVVLTLVLAPCKTVYFFISILVILIPRNRFSSKKHELLFKIGLMLAAMAFAFMGRMSLLSSQAAVGDAQPTQVFLGGKGTGELCGLGGFLSNPFHFVRLFVGSLSSQGDFYLGSLFGQRLGWLDVPIPWCITFGFFALTILATLPTSTEAERLLSLRQRIVSCVIACLVVLSIFAVMYAQWTFKTDSYIYGVQGRYFIPILPLILLALQSGAFQSKKDYTLPLVYAAVVLNVVPILKLFSTIAS